MQGLAMHPRTPTLQKTKNQWSSPSASPSCAMEGGLSRNHQGGATGKTLSGNFSSAHFINGNICKLRELGSLSPSQTIEDHTSNTNGLALPGITGRDREVNRIQGQALQSTQETFQIQTFLKLETNHCSKLSSHFCRRKRKGSS